MRLSLHWHWWKLWGAVGPAGVVVNRLCNFSLASAARLLIAVFGMGVATASALAGPSGIARDVTCTLIKFLDPICRSVLLVQLLITSLQVRLPVPGVET